MSDEKITVEKGMIVVKEVPIEERMAGLGDLKKLPIGPTLSISGEREVSVSIQPSTETEKESS